MPYRVLYQWLQQQTRNESRPDSVFDIAVHSESVLESNALDRNVAIEKSKLSLERNFLLARGRQDEAEKVAQLRDHPLGSGWISRNEGHRAIERIEQEVRIELQLQSIELRLDEPGNHALTLCRFLA